MTTIQIPTLVCKDCKKRTRAEWFAGSTFTGEPNNVIKGICPDFVRFHYHLDGVCAKWMGVRSSDPILCAACGSPRYRVGAIKATVSDTPCRDRCVTATGDNCDCECGGENHGIYAHGKD